MNFAYLKVTLKAWVEKIKEKICSCHYRALYCMNSNSYILPDAFVLVILLRSNSESFMENKRWKNFSKRNCFPLHCLRISLNKWEIEFYFSLSETFKALLKVACRKRIGLKLFSDPFCNSTECFLLKYSEQLMLRNLHFTVSDILLMVESLFREMLQHQKQTQNSRLTSSSETDNSPKSIWRLEGAGFL